MYRVERTAYQRTALTAQDGGSCLLHRLEATCDRRRFRICQVAPWAHLCSLDLHDGQKEQVEKTHN